MNHIPITRDFDEHQVIGWAEISGIFTSNWGESWILSPEVVQKEDGKLELVSLSLIPVERHPKTLKEAGYDLKEAHD